MRRAESRRCRACANVRPSPPRAWVAVALRSGPGGALSGGSVVCRGAAIVLLVRLGADPAFFEQRLADLFDLSFVLVLQIGELVLACSAGRAEELVELEVHGLG